MKHAPTLSVLLLMIAFPLLGGAKAASPATSTTPTTAPDATATLPTKAQAKSMVTYRSVVMQDLGKNMKLANLVAGGQIARPQDLPGYATVLASAPLAELFPAGTGPDVVDTGAKPELWTNQIGFSNAIKKYNDATAAVTAAAQTGDLPATKLALTQVGDACSGCHDSFRVEDNK